MITNKFFKELEKQNFPKGLRENIGLTPLEADFK